MEERRPTPEEMLARAADEEPRRRTGRLKIFFGASPGVGKTYAMLEAARVRKREGVDVVLGWVETHGRAETEVLTEGLDSLPPRIVDYRGMSLPEFDLDAALKRRPGLLLVDELAHTNAPGSRHSYRWQDVEELLDAGIDVYSTLNVQHVESLNDFVALITGVVVRETLPDSMLDRADDIEFVDLLPDDLLQRLREGKVYVPAEAARAIENFFRKTNLAALRLLALRLLAERVGTQVAGPPIRRGVPRPWAATERLLVLVGHTPRSANVIRAAYRTANRLRAPWIALSVETPAFDRLSARDQERVADHLALAAQFGAETLVVRGERAAEEILAVAHERNVTRIVVGKPTELRWRYWLRGSLVDQLVRAPGGIDVLVTTGAEEETEEAGPAAREAARPERTPFLEYQSALGTVVLSTLLCWATRSYLTLADQAMIYLLGVLIVASRVSRGPSFLASIASVAALDFFFVPPFFTFSVSDLRYLLTFLVMLAVGLTVSSFTVRIRQQAEAARQRERRTAALFAMSQEFIGERSVEEVARAAVRHVETFLETEAAVLLPDGSGNLAARAGEGWGPGGSEREMAVARWAFEHGKEAGRGTDTLPGSEALFLPLVGTVGPLGVLGIALARRRSTMTPSQRQLLDTFVAQTALALERALLAEEAARTRVAVETERTRSALLSAVSHDLRTPLASITGAAGVLLEEPDAREDGRRRELLSTIRDEADRLGRLLSDLLDLTRLESGALQAKKEWFPLEEIVASAISRLGGRLDRRSVSVDLPENVLMVAVDGVLLEQVFVNLLENAAKYSPPGSPVEIRASQGKDEVTVEVADRGPGIPADERERVFEKFYRVSAAGIGEGAGLGLAVCQAIVRAHGGVIRVEDRPGGGAVVRFTIPAAGTPPVVDADREEDGVASE